MSKFRTIEASGKQPLKSNSRHVDPCLSTSFHTSPIHRRALLLPHSVITSSGPLVYFDRPHTDLACHIFNLAIWKMRALAAAALFACMSSSGAFVVTRGGLTSVPGKAAISGVCLRSRPGLLMGVGGRGLLGAKAVAVAAPVAAPTEDGSVGMVSDVSAWHRQRNKAIRDAVTPSPP